MDSDGFAVSDLSHLFTADLPKEAELAAPQVKEKITCTHTCAFICKFSLRLTGSPTTATSPVPVGFARMKPPGQMKWPQSQQC